MQEGRFETGEVKMELSRRNFVQLAGAGLLTHSVALKSEDRAERTKVALVQGENRRENVRKALEAVDAQILPGLKRKKTVLIKPNGVNPGFQLASTHVDALRGVLDYLEPRFKGQVVIAEASSRDTLESYEKLGYNALATERKGRPVTLVDLNRERKYETALVLDKDLHMVPIKLGARLLDPDAFVISCSVLKTHNTVVATMSVKNIVLGAPLRSVRGEQPVWSEKRKFHVGIRQTHVNMLLVAERLRGNWGAAVIDGYEGMEGDGPNDGTPVESRIAIASTDYIAADRVGVEAMGIDADWLGYQRYCAEAGIGEWDLSRIEVVGPAIASVMKKYKLHPQMEQELKWMGPMKELPPVVGELRVDELLERVRAVNC
jgi:uncharacterized protein (DUF362 family)